MSDYDAVLAALDVKIEAEAALVGTEYELDPVHAAALAYARAAVEVEAANPGRDWMDATKAKNAAFEALRLAVVDTLGPEIREGAHA